MSRKNSIRKFTALVSALLFASSLRRMPYINIVWRMIIMKKRIASIALTVVMILGCMITNIDFNVNTVCADPYNIEIRVETKEISIEEIPENRRVRVDVYVSNVPNEDFYIFDVAYKLDQKLDNWIDNCLGGHAISSLSVRAGTENKHLFLESDTIIHSNKKIENGRIYDISVYIPPEVNEGDFYEITPVSDCENGYDYTSFAFESNREELYDSSNFTFISGGIKIRSSQLESQISNNPVPPSDNNNSNSQSESQNIQIQMTNNIEETIPLTSSETTPSTVSSLSSTKSTTIFTSVTSKEHTEFVTNVDTSTELLTTSETSEEKNNNTNTIKFILVLIILLLIAVIAITIIIRKRKKK